MVSRAQKNYLRKYLSKLKTIGLEQIPEECLSQEDKYDLDARDEFTFEEERLAQAYKRLSLMKKRILTMLFVDQLSPAEVARRLHCSVQNVYNQKHRALKSLKEWMNE